MVMCWVPDCKHYNNRHKCSFFTFPKNAKEKSRWIHLIRREDEPGKGARVCSCHFIDGKKSNGPEMFPWNLEKLFQPHHLTPEKRRRRTRPLPTSSTSESEIEISTMNMPSTSSRQVGSTSSYEEQEQTEETMPPIQSVNRTPQMKELFLPAAEAEMYYLRQQLEATEAKLRSVQEHFRYLHIQGNDKLINLYTGLPNTKIFETLCNLLDKIEIQYYLQWSVVTLNRRDQVLMTLMKLRQNFPNQDLALRFGVSVATVRNIVVTFCHALHEILFETCMEKIPSRRKNQSCLPNCFSTFTNCRIIKDCTEIETAVPRQSMMKQRATYSSYKHRNTWKGLVGVAPNGVITFASKLYPGSTSDKRIVAASGVVQQLQPGDLVLADKGFLIRDVLPDYVILNIPPFLSGPQLTKEQIKRTQQIARARIHVERAIRRMKVFKILRYIPQQLLSYASLIFQTVAALTNLQYPLIREVEHLYSDDSQDENE